MEFLDIFKKNKDEEVELKPGKEQGYQGFSGPAGSKKGSLKPKKDKKKSSGKKRRNEATLFPGLIENGSEKNSEKNVSKDSDGFKMGSMGSNNDRIPVGSETTDSKDKRMKRIEGKLDKLLKQNKIIIEKLEKNGGGSKTGSSESSIW